ncbi:hypothetical protein Tdes44962_MAKER10536 [Teratosphaeria destructans]|uniref:Uncharacterized protein n=1 Tax=Teratosphaeria destructans TaxID=418781 RepID=A0A9W7SZ08_9PEZI|nr:hypothetical protein Tdes44962_MAKER10536 [Teratosphaeria destructans]
MGGHQTISLFNVCEDSPPRLPAHHRPRARRRTLHAHPMAARRRRRLAEFPPRPVRAELHAQGAVDAARHAGRECAGEAAQCVGQCHEGLCGVGGRGGYGVGA